MDKYPKIQEVAPRCGSNAFSKRAFADPPAWLHPGYFWMINDRIDEAQLIAQLHDMAAQGALSVCFHPCPPQFRPRSMPTFVDRPYLSPAYFKLIKRIVAECRKLGMHYWLYDEGGWPSGGACGQVLARNPEAFLRQNIVASGSGPVVLKQRPDPQADAPYPNLLTPGVTETFLAPIRTWCRRNSLLSGGHRRLASLAGERLQRRGRLRKGENRLEVAVSNTLANAIAAPGVLRRWRDRYPPLSPYEDKQRAFEEASLAGGLFGPVKIRFGRDVPTTNHAGCARNPTKRN